MKIQRGKHIYIGREQIERAFAEVDKENQILRAQLDLVMQFSRAQLDLHQPYVNASDLDISCEEPEQMKEKLAQKLTRNIWCSRCSNPWPCGHITSLRILRDLARRWSSLEDIKAIAERMNALPKPRKRDGQIEVGL